MQEKEFMCLHLHWELDTKFLNTWMTWGVTRVQIWNWSNVSGIEICHNFTRSGLCLRERQNFCKICHDMVEIRNVSSSFWIPQQEVCCWLHMLPDLFPSQSKETGIAPQYLNVPVDRWKDVGLASGYFIVELKNLRSSRGALSWATKMEQSSTERS